MVLASGTRLVGNRAVAETLAEEKATDDKLTRMAEAKINANAEMTAA